MVEIILTLICVSVYYMILIPACYCCLHGKIIEDVKTVKEECIEEEKKSEVEWIEEEKKSEVNDSDFSLIDFSD